MNWKWFFEKGMFLIFIMTFFIAGSFNGIETSGVNKTVGWTFDQSNQLIINGYIIFGSWLVFVFGYTIVALTKRKTNLIISIAHYILFVLTFIIGIISNFSRNEVLLITIISIFMFASNMYNTFKKNH